MGTTNLLLKAAQIEAQKGTFSHPWNPDSEIIGTPLSRVVGLKRTGVSLARIRPGKESYVYHSHQFEEEWVYILSGTGIAEIDGAEYEVGPGDFMAFPTPSVAHHLRNAGSEDLVYLMGGENREFEIADFPKLGKRMLRRADGMDVFDLMDRKPGPWG
jgi:uncharacterized cupin superfamily protein